MKAMIYDDCCKSWPSLFGSEGHDLRRLLLNGHNYSWASLHSFKCLFDKTCIYINYSQNDHSTIGKSRHYFYIFNVHWQVFNVLIKFDISIFFFYIWTGIMRVMLTTIVTVIIKVDSDSSTSTIGKRKRNMWFYIFIKLLFYFSIDATYVFKFLYTLPDQPNSLYCAIWYRELQTWESRVYIEK